MTGGTARPFEEGSSFFVHGGPYGGEWFIFEMIESGIFDSLSSGRGAERFCIAKVVLLDDEWRASFSGDAKANMKIVAMTIEGRERLGAPPARKVRVFDRGDIYNVNTGQKSRDIAVEFYERPRVVVPGW